MANPYTRQSSFSDGDTVTSALFNDEYNQLVLSFSSTVGHTHDGSTGEGAPITKLGPTQDVVIAAGSMLPKTNNTVDLGSSSLKFKDGYFAGNVTVDGVVTHSGNMTIGNAATDTLTINATIQGSTLVFEGATANAHELTLAIPDATSDVTVTLPNATDTLVGKATTDVLTNKTLTSAVLNTGVSGTAVLDEDDMATDSATQLATQQSIKAYVDAAILTEDTLAELNDTDITSAADASLLLYDTGTSTWRDAAMSGAATISDTGVITIANDAIDSQHYAADSIDAEHYAAGSVDTTALGADAVTAAKLADDAVVTANIVDANVTGAKIANDAIDSQHIAADSIDAEHYAAGSVDATAIANDVVNSQHYAAASIDNEHLADDAVNTAEIADNAVTLAKMAGLARGKIIVGDASGDPSALAVGSSGYVLKSDGTDAAWAADAGLSTEEVQDIVGGMVSGNTESGITVTYEDGDGTLDFSIGQIALTTIQTAANQTAHLALTTEEGDVVVRSDENKTYMHNGGSAGSMSDFTLMATPTDAVTSVAGNTGVVTNAHIAAAVEAASGSNTFTDADHTKLNAIEANATIDQTAGEILTLIEDGVDSVHYKNGSIDEEHIADDAVTADKLANSINTAIAANTAKVTNATHTGDVTGATALTIAAGAVDIAMMSATGTASSSTFLRGDNSWTAVDALPSQSGHAGKYLTTDASSASWATLDTDANTTTKGLYEHEHTIDADYSITSGNNAMSAGPITISSGYSVTVPTGSTWVIV